VQLTEIPSDNDVNDNIVAYWRPKQPLLPDQELSFVYRQFWCWQPPERPPLAIVTGTRIGKASGKKKRFVVDFSDDRFKLADELSAFKPALSSSIGTLSRVKVTFHPERRLCRISFDLDPGNDTMSELRLLLTKGDKPASETWLYRWTA
jgi:glucans biosynthesis protein